MASPCQFKVKLDNKRLKSMCAQNITQDPEIIEISTDADQVKCDGGNGPLGHPVVWYSFDGRASVECGYCDRLFLKK